MRKEDFEKLSEEEKKNYLLKASKIAEINDGRSIAELFKIFDFYVEAITKFGRRMKESIHPIDHIPAIFRKQLIEAGNRLFNHKSGLSTN